VSKENIKIGIIAAEHSGDRLGAKLIDSLKDIYEVELYGLGGPEVDSKNINSLPKINYQDLHVMGLIDPLLNLPKLLSIRKKLLNFFIKKNIDVFIGVDSPDFNMFFHKKLKKQGIKTIQVVSPSVWGWRESRIKAIKANIDLTMCLFKFECDFYNKKNMQSFFLGHPFAQLKQGDHDKLINKYNLEKSKKFVSILPGSRVSEVSQLMPIYIDSAKHLLQHDKNLFFLIPAANTKLASMIKGLEGINQIPHQLSIGSAQDFLSISSISIVTSGTASLESAVLKSIPIICYKTNKLNYAILSRLIKTPFIGLPNLLIQKHIFPELIQNNLSIETIASSFNKIDLHPELYQSHISEINNSMTGEGFKAAATAIKNKL
jgi:lipid-A-disaccharide synthase